MNLKGEGSITLILQVFLSNVWIPIWRICRFPSMKAYRIGQSLMHHTIVCNPRTFQPLRFLAFFNYEQLLNFALLIIVFTLVFVFCLFKCFRLNTRFGFASPDHQLLAFRESMMFEDKKFSSNVRYNIVYNVPLQLAKLLTLNSLNNTCSKCCLCFNIPAVGSSGATGKRRPLSAHVSQPMPWSKPPPAFNTSKARRQLDVIEKDLKLTTKALQDRLGISKQGFVWMESIATQRIWRTVNRILKLTARFLIMN